MSKGMHRSWPPARKPRRWLLRIIGATLTAVTVTSVAQSVNIITAHAATRAGVTSGSIRTCVDFISWDNRSDDGAYWRPVLVRRMLRDSAGANLRIMTDVADLVAVLPHRSFGPLAPVIIATANLQYDCAFDA